MRAYFLFFMFFVMSLLDIGAASILPFMAVLTPSIVETNFF